MFIGHSCQQKCPMNLLCSFVHWFICLSVFFVCMKFDSHKVKQVMKPDFLKKVPSGQEGPKSPRYGPKIWFLEFKQKCNPFICTCFNQI